MRNNYFHTTNYTFANKSSPVMSIKSKALVEFILRACPDGLRVPGFIWQTDAAQSYFHKGYKIDA